MNILFTGGSSFTGYWFVRELAAAGHHVTASLTRAIDDYDGIRLERIRALQGECRLVEKTPFGSEEFLSVIAAETHWDVLCHHAAYVENYKIPEFDYLGAVESNTYQIASVMRSLADRSCKRVLATGSVFEPGEGDGDKPLKAFSAYGLSKALTHEIVVFEAERCGMPADKFVIPNPFGPFEEMRLTSYLVREWYAGREPEMKTPEYVRDNIPVSLLACVYTDFLTNEVDESNPRYARPSFYVETIRAFGERFAGEMHTRLGCDCSLRFAVQEDFSEPLARFNREPVDVGAYGWHEQEAWDQLGEHYASRFGNA